jgi:beta-1,4-mannosyl-glycoprotein beta-1,4-N-acetylglucosaminyltransferase
MLIDAFLYAWELDILEIRLHELSSVVDKFVIVESKEMHGSDNKKEFSLKDNWHIIKPFDHKIEYVLLDKLEPPFGGSDGWARENYHRNSLMAPILKVSTSPEDLVMISDVDEIPRALEMKFYKHVQETGYRNNDLIALKQDLFYYNVNTYNGFWNGTVVGPVSKIQEVGGPQSARNMRDSVKSIEEAGWHFSYFGGLDRIKTKVENFVHASDPPCKEFRNRSDAEALEDIKGGRDIYRRNDMVFSKRESDDPRLPAYFLNNREKFKHLIGG